MSLAPLLQFCSLVALAELSLGCSRNEPHAPPPAVEDRQTARAGSAPQAAAPSSAAPVNAQTVGAAAAPELGPGSGGAPALRIGPGQVFEPPGLAPGEKRPLLLFLHSFGSNGATAFYALGLGELGARERTFVLAPDGSVDRAGRHYWDAGPECCNFAGPPVDDIGRVRELIVRYVEQGKVDPKRVYAIGYSNGGFLAHRLACRLSEHVAAVASVAGAAPKSLSDCQVNSSVAVMEIHGDKDKVVPYAGGSVFNRPEIPTHAGAEEGFRGWLKLLGCADKPAEQVDLDLFAALPAAETRVLRQRGCPRGSVALLTVQGGEHYFTPEPKLLAEVWRFFAQHPKP